MCPPMWPDRQLPLLISVCRNRLASGRFDTGAYTLAPRTCVFLGRRVTTTTAVPFICNRCGTHFGQNGVVFKGDFSGVTLGQGHLNVTSQCPRCGAMNKPALPDGQYNIRGGRWELARRVTRDILSQPRTAEEIRRLAEVAREARANGGNDEQIATAIENNTSFGSLAETIRKVNREHPPGWGAYVLSIILSVIGIAFPYIMSAINSPTVAPSVPPPAVTGLSPDQIDRIARQVAQDLEGQQSRPVGKANRNEPCTCGSGVKYKKCCGDPAKRSTGADRHD
jgi:SEC-C motif